MNFETGVQQWITSLKQVCPGIIDPAASDQLWSQFRIWVRAEALKLQDINYEQAQQNFSKLLVYGMEAVLPIEVQIPS